MSQLGSADDEELVFWIVDDVLMPTVFGAPAEEQPAVVEGLSPGLRGLWGVWMVDGQVNNGGFQQFFWNDSRHYVRAAQVGYAMIGADRHLALLNEAVLRFDDQRERLERPAGRLSAKRLLSAFSEVAQEAVFDDLDTEFFKLDSMPLLAAYVRSHPDEFVA